MPVHDTPTQAYIQRNYNILFKNFFLFRHKKEYRFISITADNLSYNLRILSSGINICKTCDQCVVRAVVLVADHTFSLNLLEDH